VLAAHGISCSMSRRGNCYDNSVMEAFFSTLKGEVGERFASHADAKGELFGRTEVFHYQRRQHSAGRLSPAAFELRTTQAAWLHRPRARITHNMPCAVMLLKTAKPETSFYDFRGVRTGSGGDGERFPGWAHSPARR